MNTRSKLSVSVAATLRINYCMTQSLSLRDYIQLICDVTVPIVFIIYLIYNIH